MNVKKYNTYVLFFKTVHKLCTNLSRFSFFLKFQLAVVTTLHHLGFSIFGEAISLQLPKLKKKCRRGRVELEKKYKMSKKENQKTNC